MRAASRGAYGSAAGLLAGTLLASVASDLGAVAGRPGVVGGDASSATLAALAALPGPTPAILAGLVPAALLLAADALLRGRAGGPGLPERAGSPRMHPLRAAIGRTSDGALALLVVGVLVLAALPGCVALLGVQAISVTSGSMAPSYPPGALVLVRSVDVAALAVGDVITFRDGGGRLVTHRIDAIHQDPGPASFMTRGDAVPVADPAPVPAAAIVGRVEAGVPWLGALRAWLFSPLGVFAALLVAGVLARGTSTRRT